MTVPSHPAPGRLTEVAPAELQDLLSRAGGGDREAEAALLDRLRPAVHAFARRNSRGAEPDEFCQDAALLLIEALRERRISDASLLGGYALGVCRNLIRDRARMASRRTELWERFGLKEEPATQQEEGTLFNRAVLEDCLAHLTARVRSVVKQAFVEGSSNQQIAEALSMTEGNVRVVRHRALRQLRECLQQPLVWEAR